MGRRQPVRPRSRPPWLNEISNLKRTNGSSQRNSCMLGSNSSRKAILQFVPFVFLRFLRILSLAVWSPQHLHDDGAGPSH
jgi:hypothetical protein